MKKIPCPPYLGDHARVLTVLKKPIGIMTREYELDIPYKKFYWIRLKNGILLKDVSENEVERYPRKWIEVPED